MLIDHVHLAMPEGGQATARHFFCDLLGMEEEPESEPFRSRGGYWFRSAGCLLHLKEERGFRPQEEAHPAFLVGDLQELGMRLAAAGFPISWDDSLPGVQRFYAADPFGNRLEFIRDGEGFSQRTG